MIAVSREPVGGGGQHSKTLVGWVTCVLPTHIDTSVHHRYTHVLPVCVIWSDSRQRKWKGWGWAMLHYMQSAPSVYLESFCLPVCLLSPRSPSMDSMDGRGSDGYGWLDGWKDILAFWVRYIVARVPQHKQIACSRERQVGGSHHHHRHRSPPSLAPSPSSPPLLASGCLAGLVVALSASDQTAYFRRYFWAARGAARAIAASLRSRGPSVSW